MLDREKVSKLSDDIFEYTMTGRVDYEKIAVDLNLPPRDVLLLQSESTQEDLPYQIVRAYMDRVIKEDV